MLKLPRGQSHILKILRCIPKSERELMELKFTKNVLFFKARKDIDLFMKRNYATVAKEKCPTSNNQQPDKFKALVENNLQQGQR